MTMRLTGTLVLVLGVLAFAGSAYAGSGNGNGNGKGNDGAAPGNSADAPGQVKKDEPAAAPPVDTTTTTAAAPVTTTATNATGVKPSDDTAHDTHAEAQSDKTKQYGNGQTAGQIAEKNGAKATAVLHGPGNSQPHKAAPCSGGHEVDVHALKSHRSGGCGDPAPHPQPNPGPPVVTTATTSKTTTTSTSASITTTTTTTPAHDRSHSQPGSKPAHGESGPATAGKTQGALVATGHAATLPFTGQRLWLAVLLGVILILSGLALREIRTAEAAVESGHDHTDRSRHVARGSRATGGARAGR
jgi:hypothetical protein